MGRRKESPRFSSGAFGREPSCIGISRRTADSQNGTIAVSDKERPRPANMREQRRSPLREKSFGLALVVEDATADVGVKTDQVGDRRVLWVRSE
jgi:hypothetical protein